MVEERKEIKNTVRISEYDPETGRTKVEFTPQVRYEDGENKLKLPHLVLRGKDLSQFCEMDGAALKVDSSFIYDANLVREYLAKQKVKREGYKLQITRVSDEGEIDAKIIPGASLRGKESTIQNTSVHLTRTELNELFPPYSGQMTPVVGAKFVVPRRSLEEYYSKKTNNSKKKIAQPKTTAKKKDQEDNVKGSADDEIDPNLIELPDTSNLDDTGSGLEEAVNQK